MKQVTMAAIIREFLIYETGLSIDGMVTITKSTFCNKGYAHFSVAYRDTAGVPGTAEIKITQDLAPDQKEVKLSRIDVIQVCHMMLQEIRSQICERYVSGGDEE